MKRSIKQIIFPTPPGVSEAENDAMMRAFLTMFGVVIVFCIVGLTMALIMETN